MDEAWTEGLCVEDGLRERRVESTEPVSGSGDRPKPYADRVVFSSPNAGEARENAQNEGCNV